MFIPARYLHNLFLARYLAMLFLVTVSLLSCSVCYLMAVLLQAH